MYEVLIFYIESRIPEDAEQQIKDAIYDSSHLPLSCLFVFPETLKENSDFLSELDAEEEFFYSSGLNEQARDLVRTVSLSETARIHYTFYKAWELLSQLNDHISDWVKLFDYEKN